MSNKSAFQAFLNSPYFSIKHTNYFDVYDRLLSKYIGKPITFVEIGVLDGGSLFMWREFFGNGARIIGVDLNPNAVKWREHGFEIYVGDQSNPQFWVNFFREIGDIDILLDDGGHRNIQQIVTVQSSLPHVLDGGLVIVEDTQTSFMKFETFLRFTFISFLQQKIKSLYSRSDELNLSKDIFSKSVSSIEFFTGICVLHINRSLCKSSQRVENNGKRSFQSDFRYSIDGKIQSVFRKAYNWISWDYLSEEQSKRYPRVSRIFERDDIRTFFRILIVPIRFLIYFVLKLINVWNLKKQLRFFELY